MSEFRCADGTAPSRIGLGTVALGLARGAGAVAAQRAAAAALEAGLTLFDTAPLYGRGLAEARLGEVLAGASRDALFISSKVGRPIPADKFGADQSFQPDFDYSYRSTQDQVAASLERLRLDRLDAVMIHDIGRRTHGGHHDDRLAEAMTGAWEALSDLRRKGIVRMIGIGANEAEIMIEASAIRRMDLFLVAGRYTLLDHQPVTLSLLETAPACGQSVLLGGVFNSGILATGSTGGRFDYRPATGDVLMRVAWLEAVCTHHRVPLPAAALQFALGAPGAPALLIGPATEAELRDNLRFARQAIPSRFWGDLRQVRAISTSTPNGMALPPA